LQYKVPGEEAAALLATGQFSREQHCKGIPTIEDIPRHPMMNRLIIMLHFELARLLPNNACARTAFGWHSSTLCGEMV
jgi:hypothetical protein